jgi:tRNA pseudouridine55 synthase
MTARGRGERRRDARSASAGPDGILVVAKPAGPTSHDVVALVRRLAGTRRVGHGGTLDPFASGVLPVFLGRATRVVEYHLADRKRYRATVCFGAASTTDDLEGELTPVAGVPERAAVEAALPTFVGRIDQRPPAYSAIRVAGRRAYALARAGEPVELRPRTVTIDRLDLVEWDGADPVRPVAIVDVACSAGTYVRALARDLGAAVGSAAYLGALERVASGPFTLDLARPLDEIRDAAAAGREALDALLLPVDAGLDAFPEVVLEPEQIAAISRGQFVRVGALPAPTGEPTPIRVRDGAGRLVAIATAVDGRLGPDKVLIDAVPGPRPDIDLIAAAASEADPPETVDPDFASPDDA